MEQTPKMNGHRDLPWLLLAVETLIIVIMLVKGCLEDFEMNPPLAIQNYPGYDNIHIHSLPDKLTYVIGQDTALDLTGGQICFSDAGKEKEGFPCNALSETQCAEIRDMTMDDIVSEIDFDAEGTCLVIVEESKWTVPIQCAFTVQIISPDYAEYSKAT